MGLVAGIVVMSMVVPSRAQLHHVPPAAPTLSVLYRFAGPPTDGAFPVAGLVRDAAGNLYGTTQSAGANTACFSTYGCGVVFKLSPTGTQTVLYSFTGGADGANPSAGLVRDAAGNLYGTTTSGGTGCNGIGCGVVFKLSPTRIETVLYSFTGGPDGRDPYGGLTTDAAGNLYGTTTAGGRTTGTCKPSAEHPFGCGVVFELIRCDSAASGYEFKVLYRFTGGADGSGPNALVRDAAGNLYGTTGYGGATSACDPPSGCGVVFKLSPSGTETVLHSFSEPGDGAFPGGLVRDAAGNLYGTTGFTITSIPFFFGLGTVFKLSPNGTETVLYSFTGGADGGGPNGVVPDSAGNLYGTTYFGGGSTACYYVTGSCGVVFKLSPNGTETVLHRFTGGADGENSSAGLLRDAAGNLYGTAQYGGANTTCFSPYGCGVVFKLAP
jgi:uncharacterized repeat protein (TIGR03803 family)